MLQIILFKTVKVAAFKTVTAVKSTVIDIPVKWLKKLRSAVLV